MNEHPASAVPEREGGQENRWGPRYSTCACGGRIVSYGGRDIDRREEWGGNCETCGRGYGENPDEPPSVPASGEREGEGTQYCIQCGNPRHWSSLSPHCAGWHRPENITASARVDALVDGETLLRIGHRGYRRVPWSAREVGRAWQVNVANAWCEVSEEFALVLDELESARAQLAALRADREDAERWRALREQYVAADFEYPQFEGHASLIFALPRGAKASANLDATIDDVRAARRAHQEGRADG